MKYARLYKGMSLLVMLLVVAGCTVSYKFNGASINYDIVKTISIENFPNRAVYQWGPMESMFTLFLFSKRNLHHYDGCHHFQLVLILF